MTSPRRPIGRAPALLLAVVVPGVLLAGCGGEPAKEPTSYLLTDLEGGTAAPDAVPSATATPSSTPSTRPTRPSRPPRTTTPSPTPEAPSLDGDGLVALVAAAAGQQETVRVSIGDGTAPPPITASFVYGETDAYDATLSLGAGQQPAVLRRVQGTFYAGTATSLEPVDPADPRIATVAGGVVPAFLVWAPLEDLRAVLESATRVQATAAPAGGTTYTFDADLAALPQPSLVVPGAPTGRARATLTLDADDLPVELALRYRDAGAERTVVVGYAGWGERVQIEVPPAR